MTTPVNPDQIRKAKEWAEYVTRPAHMWSITPAAHAAAEVIQSLPEAIVDGDKLREVLDWRDSKPSGDDYDGELYGRLRALLPDRKPRTLADMSPEERVACQWRMVDTPEGEGVYLKQHVDVAAVIYPSGRHIFWSLEEVVPLLDRPGMVWPEQEARTEPHPEDVPEGECAMEEQMGEVERGYIFHDDGERTNLPERTHVRRFVTEWEEA